MGIPAFRSARLYAHYSVDDDYWRLTNLWDTTYKPVTEKRVHPRLGWSQTNVTPENPLGLQTDTLERLVADGKKKVLFYGDSFVKGAADPEFHIPKYMDRALEADVLDLGVGGYGLDQIHLLFNETISKVEDPLVIIGLLPEDIDRCILTVRTYFKPYYAEGPDGRLILKGTPVLWHQADFFKDYPPRIPSYMWRFTWRVLCKIGFVPGHQRETQKKKIVAHILDEIQSSVSEKNLKLVFVIFYSEDKLHEVDWKEIYAKEQLTLRGIPFVDTKPRLIDYAKTHGIPVSDFYVKADKHHNNLGNRVIAETILGSLAQTQK